MQQNSEEWLKLRKNFIGASDAPVIMGDCKFKTTEGLIKTPRLLWKEKLGLVNMEINTFASNYGHEMEEVSRDAYQEMFGIEMKPQVVFHPTISYLMASLDGMSSDGERLVEIKQANKDDHATVKEGKVPAHYYAQLQHQLEVCELDWMDYFSSHDGEHIPLKVYRNEQYIKALLDEEKKFWEYVLNFEEPPICQNDYIEKDEEWINAAEALWELKDFIKNAKVTEKELEDILKKLSENKACMGGGFRYASHTRSGTINYKDIPELKKIDLTQYKREPVEVWKLMKKS